MVTQYPNTGKAFVVASNSSRLPDGNWSGGEPTLDYETRCRVEVRKESQYLEGIDGKKITFSSIVYMPIPTKEIRVGTLFEVWDGEKLIVKEDVKQFSKGQLNARVWL